MMVSHGSAATSVRCGGTCSKRFVANLLNSSVKEFWKSINISRSYAQIILVCFLCLTVYMPMPKSFGGARRCLRRSSITTPSLDWISTNVGAAKMSSIFVCVHLSITILNDRIYVQDFAMKPLEYKNNFDTVGWEKVCSCLSKFNFLHVPPNGDITKCSEVQNGKIWGFLQHECNRINRSRQNLAQKHTRRL